MSEIELLQTIGKESVIFVSIILVYILFVKPINQQMNKLIKNNETLIKENSKELSKMANTMEKVSTELTRLNENQVKSSTELSTLNENQVKLKDGQDDLWKEIIEIKRESKS